MSIEREKGAGVPRRLLFATNALPMCHTVPRLRVSRGELGRLISVIYVSVADPTIGEGEIADIVTTAQRNNARDDITGALIYNGQNFMQLLEGPAIKVDACLAAIRDDRRHSGMVEIRRRAIDSREFAQWTMLYEPRFDGDPDRIAALGAKGRIDTDDERILSNFLALGRRR